MKTLRLIVCGAAGRMGQKILAAARRDVRFKLVGAVVKNRRVEGLPLLSTERLSEALNEADLAIDFSEPQAAARHAGAAARALRPIVIGVTGLSPAQRGAIATASRKAPVFLAPNMSPGMNLLFHLARTASSRLDGYDAHILEAHHRGKKDAPSGTALRLAEAVGGRPPISSVRAGDIVGEHTLVLAGPGERLELTHRAHDREVFARGALKVGAWLAGRRPGLYDFTDFLGLS